jgi:uncharacterized protein (DUF305 family)
MLRRFLGAGKQSPAQRHPTTRRTSMKLYPRFSIPMAALLLAGGAWAQSASAPMANHGPDPMSQSMKSGMDAMSRMPMSGDTDKDFAPMMKMHHQQAVDMAKVEVEHGKSPKLKAMARKIIKDQQQEILQLDAWLKKHP